MRAAPRIWLSALITASILTAWGSEAAAKKKTVEIDTDPSGADVFIEDEDGEELGTTPLSEELEPGSYTLLIRREGFELAYETIEVSSRGRSQKFFFQLQKIVYGAVEIFPARRGPDIEGARVLIDGEEIGTAPDTIDNVAAGPHQVEVIKEGYEVYEAWIEVFPDEVADVEVDLITDESYDGDYDRDRDGDRDDRDPDDAVEVEARDTEQPFMIISIGPEVGGRKFDYVQPQTTNLRPYQAFGVPLVRLNAQIYPLAAMSNPFVSGWGFVGSYAKAAPLQSATADGQTIDTNWSDFFLGGRFRLPLGSSHLGFEAGLGGQTFTFVGDPMLRDQVPDVGYRFSRFGGDVGFKFMKRFAADASFNYRLVSDLGVLGTRFARTTVSAYGGGFGVYFLWTKNWDMRVNLNYNRYTHQYVPAGSGEYDAQAGIDQFFGAQLGIGYRL